MPRSKLGLKLPVEKILAKHKCNPVALLAEMVMEKKDGKWALQGRDRLMALCRLMEYQKPKPKSVEVIGEQDRKIEINRLTYTMPETNGSTVVDITGVPGGDSKDSE